MKYELTTNDKCLYIRLALARLREAHDYLEDASALSAAGKANFAVKSAEGALKRAYEQRKAELEMKG